MTTTEPAPVDQEPSGEEERIAELRARLTERGLLRAARPPAADTGQPEEYIPAATRLSVEDLGLKGWTAPQPVHAVARIASHGWKLAAGVVAAVLVVCAVVVGALAAGPPDPQARSRAACNRFDRARTQITNGVLVGPELSAEMGRLAKDAAGGEPSVVQAVQRLAAAGGPQTAAFLVASTGLADACDALG